MIIGILLGLAAAFLQSVSYLCSRFSSSDNKDNAAGLLARSHLIIGGFSFLMLFFVYPAEAPAISTFLVPLILCAVSYFIAQGFLFAALKKSDASCVSPLLGLKIFMLSVIMVLFFKQSYTAFQFCSIAIATIAAVLLSRTGGKINIAGFVYLLLACLGYSFSDLGIKMLMDKFIFLNLMKASLVSISLCYGICGIFSAAMIPFVPRNGQLWMSSLPFAVSWYSALLFLFACFGVVGVVFGNIIQSTRGIISIVLGFLVAKAGFVHIETKHSRWVLAQRILAAILMFGAIVLFYLGAK